jgi:hypothetical protein
MLSSWSEPSSRKEIVLKTRGLPLALDDNDCLSLPTPYMLGY